MDKKEQKTLRLLYALIKGARRSDRELARVLKVSQPTVTRQRTILEKEKYIQEYTVIPNLTKMGYDFIAISFLSWAESRPELFNKARDWTKARPCLIFAANGEGLAMNTVMVSVHKDYASYSKLITDLRRDWQPSLKSTETFIISLARPELLIKDFSFRYLEDNE
jgi:DNA-binding Lrp family transcriptional regulator